VKSYWSLKKRYAVFKSDVSNGALYF
jgi:hypothetical protein